MNSSIKLCSECFQDQGLKLLAEKIGRPSSHPCSNCSTKIGFKLTIDQIEELAYRFFVVGSLFRPDYGAAPRIQFNKYQKSDINLSETLNTDIKLFEKCLDIGFFHYGPRLWMIGEIEPLKDLQNNKTRLSVFEKIINEYPTTILKETDLFYRIRANPNNPSNSNEYDSSPFPGNGRLDSINHSVLYGSQDLEVCIHECRVTIEDEIYVATLKPNKSLKLLDLTSLLEENVTEFESLDLSIQMLFLASKHSYGISQELSIYVSKKGFDGIIYPSYFSLIRTGEIPFPTVYGISTRKIALYQEYEKNRTIKNLAIFGNPIKDKYLTINNINKLYLNQISYSYGFGPVEIG
ncbi:MAG: RES family NAD+ phosphorylase [Pseudomonadota bacterium]|nr:RES family NAD+ phosphorylase [Pseudomonadota bacterium]